MRMNERRENMFSNRKCFWGIYQIPIDQFNKKHCWPPTYIKCGCSELAKHQIRRKNGHCYGTYMWQCSNCKNQYQLIKGTTNFERITEDYSTIK